MYPYCKRKYTHTHAEAHIHFFPASHTSSQTLRCTLFPQARRPFFGTLIYSAVIVVFGHFLFSSRAFIYPALFYLPASGGNIQTSYSRPLQSKQRRTSHCEGRPTTHTKINMGSAYFLLFQ